MAKRDLPKRLFKSPERVSSYQHDRSPMSRMKQVSRDHEDVLQNIEFVLVSQFREDSCVDDRACDEALGACLAHKTPEDPRAADLAGRLVAIREFREEVSDEAWDASLRVVRDSVKRHSERRPGETTYLRFAGRFIV